MMICDECGSDNIIFDGGTHEYVCMNCGLVVDDDLLDTGFHHNGSPLHSRHDYWNWNDNEFLKSRHMKSWSSKNEQWLQYKNRCLLLIMSQLGMTSDERDLVYYVLDHMSLRSIHSRLSCEACLCGVCRYAIKHINPRRLSKMYYDRDLFREYGLTHGKFIVIERNINKLFNK